MKDLSSESESNSVFKLIVEWQAKLLVLKHMAHPVLSLIIYYALYHTEYRKCYWGFVRETTRLFCLTLTVKITNFGENGNMLRISSISSGFGHKLESLHWTLFLIKHLYRHVRKCNLTMPADGAHNNNTHESIISVKILLVNSLKISRTCRVGNFINRLIYCFMIIDKLICWANLIYEYD